MQVTLQWLPTVHAQAVCSSSETANVGDVLAVRFRVACRGSATGGFGHWGSVRTGERGGVRVGAS